MLFLLLLLVVVVVVVWLVLPSTYYQYIIVQICQERQKAMEIHSFFVLALLLVSLSSPSSSDASRRVLRLSRAVSVPRARWDQSAPVSAIVGPRPGIYHSSSPSVSSPYHGRPSYYYSNARMVAAPSAYYPKVRKMWENGRTLIRDKMTCPSITVLGDPLFH